MKILQWYLKRLQSHPWSTNLTSAAVLMTVGDLTAQSLEHRRMQWIEDQLDKEKEEEEQRERETDNNTAVGIKRRQTVQYRRYGTLSPTVEELQHQRHQEHHHHTDEESAQPDVYGKLQSALQEYMKEWRLELHSYDWFRTATMAAWSTAVYTPFFLTLFSWYGRVLGPMRHVYRDGAIRACLTYTMSIPLNAAFFTYGTTVHHVLEACSASLNDSDGDGRLRQENAWQAWQTAVRLKVSTELGPTVATGAILWLPINFVNFSITPAHLRPVVLLSASVFWNAYLSLAQHRDVDIEEEEEDLPAVSNDLSLQVKKSAKV